MKTLFGSMALLALFAVGCNQSTPGGPGVAPAGSTANTTPNSTTNSTMKPDLGQAEETFRLSVPVLSTSLKQGETKTAKISISRGKNFDEDVSLQFASLPKGLTIAPASPVIKHGDESTDLTLTAAADAALGDFTIDVTGKPSQGADARTEFKVSISEK